MNLEGVEVVVVVRSGRERSEDDRSATNVTWTEVAKLGSPSGIQGTRSVPSFTPLLKVRCQLPPLQVVQGHMAKVVELMKQPYGHLMSVA